MTNFIRPILASGAVATMLFASLMSAAGTASANQTNSADTEASTALDVQLNQAFWSQETPPSPEQAAARTALPVETKQALLKVANKESLAPTDRAALKDYGLESFDPTDNRVVTTESVTTSAPVTTKALAELDAKMVEAGLVTSPAAAAAAQCWITNDEVQSWGVVQKFGWKRTVDWCANGSVVTSFHRDIEAPGYISPWWYYRGADPSQSNGTGGWELKTYRKARFENCPPVVGCGANFYPWMDITLRGNNTASISKGVN
ncbi:MAG: hypothetical protein L0G87_02540 [Renibacterium salmoninarum]|nr:hypothetical protein [Renibacterium salmoninarum]